MTIPLVTIVRGTESSIGEGVNRPFRCIVRFSDQSIRAAIVKVLSARAVAAEAFCACLLRGWGLSVPEPAIVHGPPLAFASLDMGYPNLKQRIGWFDDLPDAVARVLLAEGARIVAMLPETPRAVAADEAIDNRDRNLGNILWDGANVAWIDHERTLGLVPMEDANKLAQLVAHGADDVARIQRAAVAVALTLSAQVIDAAKAECAGIDVAAFARLVSERLGPLAARVCNRFPRPDDLLNRLT